jgi:hypothetical protein
VKRTASILALACAFATNAGAEPGGTSSVSGPTVTDGETSFEARAAAFDGGALDGNWAYRIQAEHGFTDTFQAALILRGSQPDDESAELDSAALEGRYEFQATEHWPVHLGVQGQYKFGMHDRDDEIEFKLLAEHDGGNWDARLNLIAERALVDDADWESGYAARVLWDLSEAAGLGVEAYGELDAGAHAIGPRLTYEIGDVELGFSYLAGLGEAEADQQFRFGIEWAP